MNRAIRSVLVVAAIATMSATVGATSASAATPPQVGFGATAYGSYVSTGNGAATSGPTALSLIGCTDKTGLSVSSSAARVSVTPATIGAATSSARTAATTTTRGTGAQAKATGVNLLSGAVTADAASSSSTASVNALKQYTGTNSSSLTNLRIAGRAVPVSVPANTTYSLSASGRTWATVVVNGQSKHWVGSTWQVSTTALSVRVTASNPLGLPIGTVVLVAPSSTSLLPPAAGYVGGYGYSTYVSLAGGAVKSGPLALAYPPCRGGSASANLANANVTGVVSTGTTTTSATSSVSATARSVAVRNTTSAPLLAGGVISAQTVVADTAASKAVDATTASMTDRSAFTGLQVRGFPGINDSVKPNTVVDVPGLGRVTFHKTVRDGNHLSVTMIHIVTSQPVAGLPTGSVIIVGQSESRLL